MDNENERNHNLSSVDRGVAPVGEVISPYSKTLQGKPIHGLISSTTSHGYIQVDAAAHNGTIESDGVLIVIDEEAINDISAQTFKALIILLTILTTQLPRENDITADAINKGRKVQLSVQRYMSACKIKDIKEARRQLNEAIKALYAISLEWDEKVWIVPEGKSRRKRIMKHHSMRLSDHTITEDEKNPVSGGVAEFRFSFDFAEYLAGTYIMPYPEALLSINTRYHPYSIPIGWKICTLHNMNFGKVQANTTTVKTLLSAAKGIPRYEDIAADGGIYRQIVSRFDRDLAALKEAGVLSEYCYFDKEGNHIEGAHLGHLSYTEFSNLSVHYELNNYPDQTPRIEEKQKKIKAAINRNKTASKKRAKKKENEASDGAQT